MALSLLLVSIIILLSSYVLYKYRLFRYKLPPGPRPWPVVGNLYQIEPVRFLCFTKWATTYGPIFSLMIGSTLNVVVSNGELAKEVLKENDQWLADRHRTRSAARFSRDGKDLTWADYGPHYVKVRKLCTLELFSPKRLEALRPIREDEVTSMVESICLASTKPSKSVVLRKYLEAVTFNNITRLVFGKRFVNSEGVMDEQGKELKAVDENLTRLSGSLATAEHIRWLRWMFPLEEEEFNKQESRRDCLTRTIMQEHTLARRRSGKSKQHFIDALLVLQEKYDLSEDTIIGLLWDMLAAGTDTAVIAVEWTLAEVIKNMRVQQKGQEELDRVIGFERVMTEADFSSLPYLQCIVKEGLRMHPPAPLSLPHRANVDATIGGYDVPKGTTVHVNVWAIGRDPDVWENPNEFRPERFLEEDVDVKGHDFRLLPFGGGRRVCIGAQLGMNLVTSMLGHLLHHFSWTTAPGMKQDDIDMADTPGLVNYMRTPLQAVATPRLPLPLYKRVPADI